MGVYPAVQAIEPDQTRSGHSVGRAAGDQLLIIYAIVIALIALIALLLPDAPHRGASGRNMIHSATLSIL
jgi:hypothetical protein